MSRLEKAKSHFESILLNAGSYIDNDLNERAPFSLSNNTISLPKGREDILLSTSMHHQSDGVIIDTCK